MARTNIINGSQCDHRGCTQCFSEDGSSIRKVEAKLTRIKDHQSRAESSYSGTQTEDCSSRPPRPRTPSRTRTPRARSPFNNQGRRGLRALFRRCVECTLLSAESLRLTFDSLPRNDVLGLRIRIGIQVPQHVLCKAMFGSTADSKLCNGPFELKDQL